MMAIPLMLGTLSFLTAVIWGRPLISLLKHYDIGKWVRVTGPKGHLAKMGTPTMGGWMFVLPILLITGILNIFNFIGFNVIGASTLLLFFCLGAFALLGTYDDFKSLVRNREKLEHRDSDEEEEDRGMTARVKSGVQVLLATIIALVLYFGPPQLDAVGVPGIARPVHVGWITIPIAVFLIVGFSNAVNLADGLDSLAGSMATVSFVSYGIIANLQGATYIAIFCFIVVGSLFAFLWYNAHPAQLFMGDTGSLPLGATLALVALMTQQWLILPVIGLIFVAVALSVILQVVSSKLSLRFLNRDWRPFKMTPLQHHFELIGWSEMQVKERFWIVSVLSGMLGVALALF